MTKRIDKVLTNSRNLKLTVRTGEIDGNQLQTAEVEVELFGYKAGTEIDIYSFNEAPIEAGKFHRAVLQRLFTAVLNQAVMDTDAAELNIALCINNLQDQVKKECEANEQE